MGNQLAGVPTELNIGDLNKGFVQKAELGGGKGRLLKGLHCECENVDVVVKVYIKRDQSDTPRLKRAYEKLIDVRQKLQSHTERLWQARSRITNVCGYARIEESEKAGFVVRQYFYQSLYERIVTRPFLSHVAKCWIAFQLLKAVDELHNLGVPHGDLKAENVMMCSYGWLYVTDMAPFKPTFIKHDNPADFSFYFDTTEQHHCNIAPERFYDSKEEPPDLEHPVTEKMDVFSAGCVIAQLFMNGDVLFTLPDLLSYRKGQFDPFAVLDSRVEDPDVRSMLKHMLQLNPKDRFEAKTYIQNWTPKVFRYFFDVFYNNINGTLISLNPDERMHVVYSRFDDVVEAICSVRTGNGVEPQTASRDQDVQEGLALLSVLICGSIRHCRLVESRVLGLHVFDRMADFATDDARLQRLIPYTIALLSSDPSPLVRAKAIQTIATIVAGVQAFPPSEASLFEEYILPALVKIPKDPSELVRSVFAQCLPEIAHHARRFLETRQLIHRLPTAQAAVAETGGAPEKDAGGKEQPTPKDAKESERGGYDAELNELLDSFEGILRDLTSDRSLLVLRSLLEDIPKLCVFFGIRRTIDFLLPILTTFLSSKDSQLRRNLYQQLVGVGCFVGPTSLQEYILPCMEQSLNDMEEYVVAEGLNGLATLCSSGLFNRESIVRLTHDIVPLLVHPNAWIRKGAVQFVVSSVSSGSKLSAVEVLCYVMPILNPFLKFAPVKVDKQSMKECLIPPVSRHGFDRAMRTAMAIETRKMLPADQHGSKDTPTPSASPLLPLSGLSPPHRHEDDPVLSRFTPDQRRPQPPPPPPAQPHLQPHQAHPPSRQFASSSFSSTTDSPSPNSFGSVASTGGLSAVLGEDSRLALMQKYINHTAASISRVKRMWGGSSAEHEKFSTQGLTTHKVTEVSVLRVSNRQPQPAPLGMEFQIDPSQANAASTSISEQCSAEETWDLRGLPIRFRPTPRQQQRLIHYSANADLGNISRHNSPSARPSGTASSPLNAVLPGLVSDNVGPESSFSVPLTFDHSVSMTVEESHGTHPMGHVESLDTLPMSPAKYGAVTPSMYGPNSPTMVRSFDRPMFGATAQPPPAAALPSSSAAASSSAGASSSSTSTGGGGAGGGGGATAGSGSASRRVTSPPPPPQLSLLAGVRPSSPLMCQARQHDGAVLDSTPHDTLPIFLTAGADGTLRLWDLQRLDADAALISQRVYPQNPDPTKRMLSCQMQMALANTAAAGTDDGSFFVFDLETGVEFYHDKPVDGMAGGLSCMRRVTGTGTVICGTFNGFVCALDTRQGGEAWHHAIDTRHGPITSLVLGDEHGKGSAVWMVTSTMRGFVTLWDLRFRVPVTTWQCPQNTPTVYALSLSGREPSILMGAKHNQVFRWNLESMRCSHVYKAFPEYTVPASTPQAASSANFEGGAGPGSAASAPSSGSSVRISSPPLAPVGSSGGSMPPPPSRSPLTFTPNVFTVPMINPCVTTSNTVRAICGFRECNWFITGGTDRRIRFWDCAQPNASYTISGLEPGEQQPKYVDARVQNTIEIREEPPALSVSGAGFDVFTMSPHPQTSALSRNLTAHKDCITSLTLIPPLPDTQIPLLVSSSRDGCVKVWQNRVLQPAQTEKRS